MSDPRKIYAITGSDRTEFLQGLVTNDVNQMTGRLVYAAMLSPQGKYLADFFLTEDDDRILLDVAESLAKGFIQRLTMYKLRADVHIEEAPEKLSRGVGNAPEGALADPRHPDLGWRLYSSSPLPDSDIDWNAIRVAHCIPETAIELQADETYILEAGFERLNGVDFRKGCYVGQEVTARMKHKTELRKGFATVSIHGVAPTGTPIESNGKSVGYLFTQAGNRAIAYLRFDRAQGEMLAGNAQVQYDVTSKN
ncbi:MAG: folate-binding protein [Pseudoruegeria sp.]